MIGTDSKDKYQTLRAELEEILASFDTRLPPSLRDALESILTAVNYKDDTLIRSAAVGAMDALVRTVDEAAMKRVRWSINAFEGVQNILSNIEDEPLEPNEDLDELGKLVKEIHDKVTDTLLDTKSELSSTLSRFRPETLAAIETEIGKWAKTGQDVIDNWPWTARTWPSPTTADQELLQRSKGSAEGTDVREIIRRLGSQ